MPFRYLKDPLFLTCAAVFIVHRCLKTFDLSPWWLRFYLNDVICIPFFVPMMVWANRRLGLRRHDEPPEGFEIVIPLLLWAFVFEVLLPYRRDWAVPAVADPYDVFCYAAGALAATLFWQRYYRPAKRNLCQTR